VSAIELHSINREWDRLEEEESLLKKRRDELKDRYQRNLVRMGMIQEDWSSSDFRGYRGQIIAITGNAHYKYQMTHAIQVGDILIFESWLPYSDARIGQWVSFEAQLGLPTGKRILGAQGKKLPEVHVLNIKNVQNIRGPGG